MPTTSDIRNMTESKRIALGFQSRRHDNYKSASQLPASRDIAKWSMADVMPKNGYFIDK